MSATFDLLLSAAPDPVDAVDEGGCTSIDDQRQQLLSVIHAMIGQPVPPQPADSRLGEAAFLAQMLSMVRQVQPLALHSQKLEAIGQLAAGIAHEINTPIQFISDNVAFLKQAFMLLDPRADGSSAANERQLRYAREQIPLAFEQTIEGLQRVILIVSAMKRLSHASNGQRDSVDMIDIINTTSVVSRNEWKYVADMQIDVTPQMPPVPCIRDDIYSVLLNIIINAAHAIASQVEAGRYEKGLIQIRARALADCVRITIVDNGCGIADTARGRVFEPFYSTKAVGKGTGQGLAIAHSIVVQKHRGRLWFDSVPGEGTSFHIELPLQATTE